MPIIARCGECGQRYRLADSRTGEELECKKCGVFFSVPEGDSPGRRPSTGQKSSGGRGNEPMSAWKEYLLRPTILHMMFIVIIGIGICVAIALPAIKAVMNDVDLEIANRGADGNSTQPVAVPKSSVARRLHHLGRTKTVYSHLAFSSNGAQLLASPLIGATEIWTIDAEPKAQPVTTISPLSLTGLSPDGATVYTHFGRESKLWNIRTGKSVPLVTQQRLRITHAAFSNDSRTIYLAGSSIDSFDVATGNRKQHYDARGNATKAVTPSNDGKRLFCTDGHHIFTWDLTTNNSTGTIKVTMPTGSVSTAAIAGDGKWAVFSDTHKVYVWNMQTGQLQYTLNVHAQSIAVAANGTRAVMSVGKDILIWDVVTGKTIDRIQVGRRAVSAIAINAGGNRVACSGHDQYLDVWEVP